MGAERGARKGGDGGSKQKTRGYRKQGVMTGATDREVHRAMYDGMGQGQTRFRSV